MLRIPLQTVNQGKFEDGEGMSYLSIFEKKKTKILKFKPDFDCFATRLNTQDPIYVSYKPDLFAYLIGALSVKWEVYKCYLFP